PVDSAHYAAFPSGHAMTATFVCGLLVWLLHHYGAGRGLRRAGLALAVVSVAGVGVTRVWLGVHWTTDVLGGWLLGALVVALAVLVHRYQHPASPDDRT
ncbi:phosphatase PAP2 family protein, partial [Streptomyces coelicoflavus]|uniref:phosphatase PAP2 family protein n=1 Tax=Streptomyces coelicoflavus TaxID=285562 RepID=UPI0036BA30A6